MGQVFHEQIDYPGCPLNDLSVFQPQRSRGSGDGLCEPHRICDSFVRQWILWESEQEHRSRAKHQQEYVFAQFISIYNSIIQYIYISSLLSFFSSWEPCLRNGMAVSTEVKHFCSPGDFLITAQRSVGLEGVENGQKECNIWKWKYDKIWLVYGYIVSIQGLGWGFHTIKITMCFWFWFSLSPGDMHCLNKMCYSAECRGRRSWQICLCSPSSRSSSFPQWSWVCKYLGFISPLHRYKSITSPVMGLIDVDPREAIQNLVAKAQINKSPLLAEYRNHPKLAKRRRRTSLKFR